MAIKTRQTNATGVTNKNAPLTNSELDNNFVELQTNKQDKLSEGAFVNGDKTKLDGIATNANNYSLPLATSSVRGGAKIGYGQNGKNYPVQLSSEQMYVNVPWTDTTTNQTITLSGDVSGSGTTSISCTVADNSHNHNYFVVNGTTNLNSVPNSNWSNFVPFTSNFQASNRPGTNYAGGFEIGIASSSDNYRGQLAFVAGGANVGPYVRTKTSGTWNSWNELWHQGNDGSGSGLDADKLDGIEASSFIRSDADDSISGDLNTTGAISYTDGGGIHVLRPQGGMFTGTNNFSGAIRITLPVSWTNTMLRFEVDIYEYDGDTEGHSTKVLVGGYNYSASSTWANCFAHLISGRSDKNYTVYFGHDGSKCVVIINPGLTYNWAYPQISISNFFGGYSGATAANWADGWGIGFISFLSGYTITKTCTAKMVAYDSESLGGIAASGYIRSNAADTVTEDTTWTDNDQVRLGTGGDMQLYHDGSASYINNSTGPLNIRAGGNSIYFQANDTSNVVHTCAKATGGVTYPNFSLYYDGGLRFSTSSSGNICWGPSSANSQLAMYASDGDYFGGLYGAEGDYIGVLDGDGNWAWQHRKDNHHQFLINNTTVLQLSGGNALFTTGTDEKIILAGSSNPYIRFRESTTDRAYIQWVSTSDCLRFRNQQSDNFEFMTHDSTGAVRIRLMGSDGDDWGSVYANNSQEVGFLDEGGSWAYLIRNDTYHRWYVAGAEEMRLESDGDLHVEGDVIAYSTTVSDRRLKDNIKNIENALDKVDQINGVTFLRKDSGRDSAGVIAQEIMEVLPEAVKEKALPLQKDDGEKYYVVEYDAVTGLLVEAIKELKARVEALEAK